MKDKVENRTEFFAGSVPLSAISLRSNQYHLYYLEKITVCDMVYRLDTRSSQYLIGAKGDTISGYTEVWDVKGIYTMEDMFAQMRHQLFLDADDVEVEYKTYL